jgi:hypothetical protein
MYHNDVRKETILQNVGCRGRRKDAYGRKDLYEYP